MANNRLSLGVPFGLPMQPRNDLPAMVGGIMGMIRGQNPQRLLQQLCMKDPEIKQFIDNCQGKSPEQIAAECGVDYDFLKSLIR